MVRIGLLPKCGAVQFVFQSALDSSVNEEMLLTTFKRAVRKMDWLIRCSLLLLTGVCLTLLVSWMWSDNPIYLPRSDPDVIKQYIDIPSNLQLLSLQSSSCPPCPDLYTDKVFDASGNVDMKVINCSINGVELIECRRDKSGMYMPVKFINSYFEVSGSIATEGSGTVYNFQHATGKIHPVQPVYHPGGLFLNFDHYNVEYREYIACVTASDGVPLVSQWDPAGYYYPITVAQFGLSHHAKGIIEGNLVPKLVAGGDVTTAVWENVQFGMSVEVVEATTPAGTSKVISFNAPDSLTSPGPVLRLNTKEKTIRMHLLLTGPGGVTIQIRNKEGGSGFIHFTLDDAYKTVNGNHVIYGMSQLSIGKWVHLVRDVDVDWMKTIGKTPFNSPKRFAEIVDITLHGTGLLDNMTISMSAHNDQLIHAADWLVRNQDDQGGWATSVGMRSGDGIELKPGWYSAMAQGQAISTLVRAFNVTGQKHYLDSVLRALHLYELGSDEGGVRARFLGQLDWYEEYPTTPTSTFVLNGFIFSMLGLYDAMKTVDGEGQKLAEKLWASGLHSLKTMIGMYDSGAGTLYDLRHIINNERPNRARWDYHTAHIALIEEMAIIDGDPIFHSTFKRWVDYFYGKRSRLN